VARLAGVELVGPGDRPGGEPGVVFETWRIEQASAALRQSCMAISSTT
jgi:hypothetical protein